MSTQKKLAFLIMFFAAIVGLTEAAHCQTTLEARKAAVLSTYARVTDFSISPKVGPYQVLAITASQGCSQPRLSKYMSELIKVGAKGKKGPLDFEMFSLPPLVRYLYMYGNCFSTDELALIKNRISSARVNLSAHGTLNHAIMQATSWYLIAQYFPDVIWTTSEGDEVSSQEVMERLKEKLLVRTTSFYLNGYYEQSSPTYAMVNFFPLLNIIEFSKDKNLQQSSEREAILILALLKANSFHGRLVPPLTRHTHPQTISQDARALATIPAVTQHILWYYFGEPELSRFDLQNKREPYYVAMLALSKWSSPFSAEEVSKDYIATVNTPAFSIWGAPTIREIYGRQYVSKNFAIGGGNSVLEPGGYNLDTAAFGIIYRARKTFGLIDCYHPYYRSNSGDMAWENDRSSPFEEIYIGGRTGILIFKVPDADPYKFDNRNRFFMARDKNADSLLKVINCRLPASAESIESKNGVIYVRDGDIFAALKAENGTFENRKSTNPDMIGYRSFSISSARNAVYFAVFDASSFASFEAFKKYVDSKSISETPEGYTYVDEDGASVEVQYSARTVGKDRLRLIPDVFKNGDRISFEDDPAVVKSPNISLQSGRLTLKCNGSDDVTLDLNVDVPQFPAPCRL